MTTASQIEKVNTMLHALNLPAEGPAAEQLVMYYRLLTERNRVMNLTAITEFGDVVEKHFADSLLLAQIIDLKQAESLIDVGTGAGFPGIPLKILFPEIEMTLLDSLQKRVGFLNEAIQALGLQNIRAVHGRAEDFGRDAAYRERYHLCVSRAVADLSVLSELCLPFVRQGGSFVSYKSAGAGEEIAAAARAVGLLGGAPAQVKQVFLPETGQARLLVLIQKETETPAHYPRRAGVPAKKPL